MRPVHHAWKKLFLMEVGKGMPTQTAAARVGVGLDKLYAEKKRDPEFAKEWDVTRQNSGAQPKW